MYFEESGYAPMFGNLVEDFLSINENEEAIYDSLRLDFNVDMERLLTVDNYMDSVEECLEHFDTLGLEYGHDFQAPGLLSFFRPVLVMYDDLRPRFFVNERRLASHAYANSQRNIRAWNASRGIQTLPGWLEGLKPYRKVLALTPIRIPGARFKDLPER